MAYDNDQKMLEKYIATSKCARAVAIFIKPVYDVIDMSVAIRRCLKASDDTEGMSIIVDTHGPEAARFGNRQLRLKDGRIENRQD